LTTRRLAAILAADVVGFSTLMEKDEEGTASHIRTMRREVIEPALSAHHGRLVKTTGDGFLAEFASPVEAVRCALGIQDRVAEQGVSNGGLALRIGINLGDIIIEDDGDVFGDGVNVAARLEQMADPGGVLISGKIYEEIEGKIERRFESRGEQQVKNLARRVRVYALAGGTPSRGKQEPPALPDKPSIAVLPFTNMSGAEDDYFCDGIAEDILTALSRIRWLFVIAQNSSFVFKGLSIGAEEAAQRLGVRYILEGSVRRAGGRARVTGQLIDAATGAHVWADRYDRDMTDIFAVQDEITQKVVSAIEPSLRSVEIQRVRAKPTENLGAYELYLQALPELHSYRREGLQRAEAMLREAIARDGNFADAWGALADCLTRLTANGWTPDFRLSTSQALEAASRAVRADPESGPSLAIAAWTFSMLGGSFGQALDLAHQALKVHPNSAYVRVCCGWTYVFSGEEELALEQFEAARRMSPVDPRAYLTFSAMAAAHFFARRFEESVHWSGRALEETQMVVPLRYRAAALVHLGRLGEARSSIATILTKQPDLTIRFLRESFKFRHPWMTDMYLDALKVAGLPE
jgi:adenylate cyclase